jgi:hypothetical protein
MAGPASKYLLREHKLRRAHNFISRDMRGSLKGLATDRGEYRQAAGVITKPILTYRKEPLPHSNKN